MKETTGKESNFQVFGLKKSDSKEMIKKAVNGSRTKKKLGDGNGLNPKEEEKHTFYLIDDARKELKEYCKVCEMLSDLPTPIPITPETSTAGFRFSYETKGSSFADWFGQ